MRRKLFITGIIAAVLAVFFVAAFVKLPDQFGSDEGVQRNSQ